MVRGFNRKMSHEYEHTRALCYMYASVNRDPKKAWPSIQKFWPLPTDEDSAIDEKAEEKRLMGIMEQFKQGKLYGTGGS